MGSLLGNSNYEYLKQNPYDKLVRKPYPSELDFFKNLHYPVAGMATEDNRIIINPNNGLNEKQNNALKKLEASRIYMKQNNLNPNLDLTPGQKQFFNNTPYRDLPNESKQSMISRFLVNDYGTQTTPTVEQQRYTDYIDMLLNNWIQNYK